MIRSACLFVLAFASVLQAAPPPVSPVIVRDPTGKGCAVFVGFNGNRAIIVTAGHNFRGIQNRICEAGFDGAWYTANIVDYRASRGLMLTTDIGVATVPAKPSIVPCKYAERNPVPGEEVRIESYKYADALKQRSEVRKVLRCDATHFVISGGVDRGESGAPVFAGGKLAGIIIASNDQETVCTPITTISGFVHQVLGEVQMTNPAAPATTAAPGPTFAQDATPAATQKKPATGPLIFFTATWCEPCKVMHPTIDALEKEGFTIQRVDVDTEKAFAKTWNVAAIPTFLVPAPDGKTGRRIVGTTSIEALRSLITTPLPLKEMQAPNCSRPYVPEVQVGGQSVPFAQTPEFLPPVVPGVSEPIREPIPDPVSTPALADEIQKLTVRLDRLDDAVLNLEPIEGPPGPPGKQGPEGKQGPQGLPGDNTKAAAAIATLRKEIQSLRAEWRALSGEMTIRVVPDVRGE